jgi:hypothetical protein
MKKIFFACFVAASMVMVSCGESNKPAEDNAENTESAEVEAAKSDETEEAAAALSALYDGVAESISNVESKEELVTICQEFGKAINDFSTTYPDFDPDDETNKVYAEAGIEIGKAIGTKGLELGMSQEEIAECSNYIAGE